MSNTRSIGEQCTFHQSLSGMTERLYHKPQHTTKFDQASSLDILLSPQNSSESITLSCSSHWADKQASEDLL